MTQLPPRDALERVAERAGTAALAHFRRVTPERKADRTLVTQADRDVEAMLVRDLAALLPAAAILGEEGTTRQGSGSLRIVIDPIDGTSAFVAGLPTWCVSVGILDGTRPVAGVVHVPCAQETYTALGADAWWNGSPLPALAAVAPSADAFILVHAKTHLRHRLTYAGKARSLGSAAYHAALVARGVAEAALLGRVHVWDVAAAAAILAAVGGALWYLSGEAVDLGRLLDGGRTPDYVVAATPRQLARLLPSVT